MKYSVYANGKQLDIQTARVSAMPFNQVWNGEQRDITQSEEAYFVSFDLCGNVNLEIVINENFEKYELRPLSEDFKEQRKNNSVFLTLNKPMQFILEADGIHNPLMIFANPKCTMPSENVIYYGKGEHKADLIWLESNTTVYIDEGAVVYGVIYGLNVENVKILGRGVLDSSPYRRGNDDHEGGREVINSLLDKGFTPTDMKYAGNLVLNHCKNCTVEGIILRDAPMWSVIIRNDCEDIVVDNIKVIGQWRYNSDGINICTSRNVVVKNCFVRSFDDCIITRGAYLEGENGNVTDVIVDNCTLWCDWGKCLETWCGHKPTKISNVVFKNIKMIHLSVRAMNITTWYGSSNSVVDGVTYENILIDLDEKYPFLQIQNNDNQTYVPRFGFKPYVLSVAVERLGRMVDLGSQICEKTDDYSDFNIYFGNIHYKNVRYFGSIQKLPINIKEFSEIHKIENVTAEDCDFNI